MTDWKTCTKERQCDICRYCDWVREYGIIEAQEMQKKVKANLKKAKK